eukprot:13538-Prymnesium_polylepis.1
MWSWLARRAGGAARVCVCVTAMVTARLGRHTWAVVRTSSSKLRREANLAKCKKFGRNSGLAQNPTPGLSKRRCETPRVARSGAGSRAGRA